MEAYAGTLKIFKDVSDAGQTSDVVRRCQTLSGRQAEGFAHGCSQGIRESGDSRGIARDSQGFAGIRGGFAVNSRWIREDSRRIRARSQILGGFACCVTHNSQTIRTDSQTIHMPTHPYAV